MKNYESPVASAVSITVTDILLASAELRSGGTQQIEQLSSFVWNG